MFSDESTSKESLSLKLSAWGVQNKTVSCLLNKRQAQFWSSNVALLPRTTAAVCLPPPRGRSGSRGRCLFSISPAVRPLLHPLPEGASSTLSQNSFCHKLSRGHWEITFLFSYFELPKHVVPPLWHFFFDNLSCNIITWYNNKYNMLTI